MAAIGDLWRLFIAVPVPDRVKREMAAWCGNQQKILQFRKWVHQDDYHITVQFLGDTEGNRIDVLKETIERAAAKAGVHSFSLEAAGCGIFGQSANPRVLWAGVRGDIAALGKLQVSVASANEALGFVPEERPYWPHITLARKYDREEKMKTGVLDDTAPVFGAWDVTSLVIYRTDMHKSPIYEAVKTVFL